MLAVLSMKKRKIYPGNMRKALEQATTTRWYTMEMVLMTKCKLCSVRNCMGDLIVNIALELLYIHEEGVGNKTTGETNI